MRGLLKEFNFKSEVDMRSQRILSLLVAVLISFAGEGFANAQTFADYCTGAYAKGAGCPPASCQLQCADGSKAPECPLACVPRDCQTISADSCPRQFCSIIENCSKQKICMAKIPEGLVPDCGALAYNGQDVECCKGMVKRCGFDYLDGKCNMEGKNSQYALPICIPCGDGVCTNFENHCNCPEDCKKDIIPL